MWSPPLDSTASEWVDVMARLREQQDLELAPQHGHCSYHSEEELCSVSDGCEETDPTLGLPGSPTDGYGAVYSFPVDLEADPITSGENGGCLSSRISEYDYTLSPLQLSVPVASSSSRSVGLSAVPVGGHVQNLPASELFCGELLCPRVSPLFQEQPDEVSGDSALSTNSSGSSINKGKTNASPTTPQLSFIKEVSSSGPKRHASRQSIKDPTKNKNEHERVMMKNEKLQQLKHLILLILIQLGFNQPTGGKRWTEKQILEKAIACINQLHLTAHSYGHVLTTPKPFFQKSSGASSLRKKQPNIFLSFSEVMRSSFLQVMKRTLWPDMEHDEHQEVKIDNRHVTKLLSAVWNGLPIEEKRQNWSHLSYHERKPYIDRARQIILENLRQGGV